jgi:4'-phosphopantetheinyl transferase
MRWLACGETELPAGLEWLTSAEARHADGLCYTKRRNEFLLRRFVAKRAVAKMLGLPGLELIDVGHTPDGAPRVVVGGQPVRLTISLSDRAGWAVCVVDQGDPGRAVGCDLELAEPRTPGFVRDFLTPAEQAYVAAAPDPEVAANLIWSAKESALKVLHAGLRRDTRGVEVSVHEALPSGWGALGIRAVEGRHFAGWWRHDGRFLFTVAAEAGRGVPAVTVPVALEYPRVLESATPVHSWLDRPYRAPGRRSDMAAAAERE